MENGPFMNDLPSKNGDFQMMINDGLYWWIMVVNPMDTDGWRMVNNN